MHSAVAQWMLTLIYLIAEQDVLSEQALNSKIHPARFLFTIYIVECLRTRSDYLAYSWNWKSIAQWILQDCYLVLARSKTSWQAHFLNDIFETDLAIISQTFKPNFRKFIKLITKPSLFWKMINKSKPEWYFWGLI